LGLLGTGAQPQARAASCSARHNRACQPGPPGHLPLTVLVLHPVLHDLELQLPDSCQDRVLHVLICAVQDLEVTGGPAGKGEGEWVNTRKPGVVLGPQRPPVLGSI
jgi:hypothetical protein